MAMSPACLAVLRFAGLERRGKRELFQLAPPVPTVPVRGWAEVGQAKSYEVEALLDDGTRFPLGIAEASVSRRHARLSWEQGQLMVRDLGSRNGTWLDGERIPHAGHGQEGPPVPVPGRRAILTLGRLLLEVRVLDRRSQGVAVSEQEWQSLLANSTSVRMSEAFTSRLRAGANEQERRLTIFTHLMDAMAQHPEVPPQLVCLFLMTAYREDRLLLEAFQWLQAQNLGEGQLAVLKDPSLIIRLAEARAQPVAALLRNAPQEALRSWDGVKGELEKQLVQLRGHGNPPA